MSYYTLAISSSSHDASICLLEDDRIVVAYSCERISRRKHTQAILQSDLAIILRYTKQVDKVILVNVVETGEAKHVENVNAIRNKLNTIGLLYKKVVVDNANHHLFHAAAGFYTSGLSDAICVVIDGFGSIKELPQASLAETTTLFYVKDSFETLHKYLMYRSKSERLGGWLGLSNQQIASTEKTYKYPVTISSHLDIGKMYGTVTRYIGYATVDAGKTMGLSGYGRPNDLPSMFVDDTTISNNNLFRYDSHIDIQCYPALANPSFQTRADMAYNVQRALEKIFVERVASALKIKYSNNVILGGGCALNILGNSVIKKHFPDLNVYVEPIGSDAAQSIGAALYHYKLEFPDTKFTKIDNLYFGPRHELSTVKQRLIQLVEQYNNESTL